MGIHAKDPEAGQGKEGSDFFDVLRPLAQTVHPGVDFQMHFDRIGGRRVQSPGVGAVRRSLDQIVRDEKGSLLGRRVAEDQDFAPDPGPAKLYSLLQGSHGKGAHADAVQIRGDRDGPVPVGVGLDDGHEGAALRQKSRELFHVPFQVFKVQLLPGAPLRHQPDNHGVRAYVCDHDIPSCQ